MKNIAILALLAGTTALTGCNKVVLPDMTSTGSVFGAVHAPAYTHTIAEKRPVQEAFLKLPASAGNIVEVTERRHGNGVEQVIIYQGDLVTRGENAARVQLVAKNVWPKPQTGELSISPVSEKVLAREMRKALPGVSMRVANQLQSNAYGPYGYALGRAGNNVTCLFGWQRLSAQTRRFVGLPVFNMKKDKPELSLRVRVCRQGASSRQMVDIMQHLRIEADPTAVLAKKSVTWGAGPKMANTSLINSAYEPGGYVSEPNIPVAVETPKSEVKPARRKAVKARRKVVKKVSRKTRKPSAVQALAPRDNRSTIHDTRTTAFVPLPTPSTVASVSPKTNMPRSTKIVQQPFPTTTTRARVPYTSPAKTPIVMKEQRISKPAKAGIVPLPL